MTRMYSPFRLDDRSPVTVLRVYHDVFATPTSSSYGDVRAYQPLPLAMEEAVEMRWFEIHSGTPVMIIAVALERGHPYPIYSRDGSAFWNSIGGWDWKRECFRIHDYIRVDDLPPQEELPWYGEYLKGLRTHQLPSALSLEYRCYVERELIPSALQLLEQLLHGTISLSPTTFGTLDYKRLCQQKIWHCVLAYCLCFAAVELKAEKFYAGRKKVCPVILTEKDLDALETMVDALRIADVELFSWDELDHERAGQGGWWCVTCLLKRQIDAQAEVLIRRFTQEIVQRISLPFAQFKEEIPLYIRALAICEVGFRYPFVDRGSDEFLQRFGKIHIEHMVEEHYPSRLPKQKIALMVNLWKQEHVALVHRKDAGNDWEYSSTGWNVPHDGGPCPRCEAHGRASTRCTTCGICHTCYATFADIRHRTLQVRQEEDRRNPVVGCHVLRTGELFCNTCSVKHSKRLIYKENTSSLRREDVNEQTGACVDCRISLFALASQMSLEG